MRIAIVVRREKLLNHDLSSVISRSSDQDSTALPNHLRCPSFVDLLASLNLNPLRRQPASPASSYLTSSSTSSASLPHPLNPTPTLNLLPSSALIAFAVPLVLLTASPFSAALRSRYANVSRRVPQLQYL